LDLFNWSNSFLYLSLYSEEHNKRVFHQQMVETGSSLLFDGEYGGGGHSAYDDGQQQYGVAPYATQNFHPQTNGYGGGYNNGGGNYGGPGRYWGNANILDKKDELLFAST